MGRPESNDYDKYASREYDKYASYASKVSNFSVSGSGRCGVGLKLKEQNGKVVIDKIQRDR